MRNERDIKHDTVFEANGYTVVRSEAKKFDKIEQTFIGHKKVYYDVCDQDGDLLETFKTLKEAKSFCMA